MKIGRIFGLLLILAAGSVMPVQAQHAGDSLTTPRAESLAVQQPVVPAASESVEQLWDAANTDYINANYHGAIEAYEKLLAQGYASEKLYYNLANAYFKAGHHGKAILYYNRALRLAPGDADIRYNLDVANTFTKDRIAVVPEFFLKTWVRTIRSSLGCTAWSLLSLGALALMFILVLVYLLAGRLVWRKTGFYGMLVMFVCFFAFTAFAISERNEQLDSTEAVVMSSSVSVKSSPDKSSTDLFVLHEGTKVRTVNELDDWREIVIADGKKGWVEARTIETI
ncbi:tetratricopeptide repeat protein [uncultured Alistipes sp.]|uniref:tetratricopeptide repeat protein n=1 Tax=uncultured Alistipes sp. TaxID=538949 RepID=UPI0026023E25|nr:tetratricopeptide repeat protein [uncultured Alistipes sp.]